MPSQRRSRAAPEWCRANVAAAAELPPRDPSLSGKRSTRCVPDSSRAVAPALPTRSLAVAVVAACHWGGRRDARHERRRQRRVRSETAALLRPAKVLVEIGVTSSRRALSCTANAPASTFGVTPFDGGDRQTRASPSVIQLTQAGVRDRCSKRRSSRREGGHDILSLRSGANHRIRSACGAAPSGELLRVFKRKGERVAGYQDLRPGRRRARRSCTIFEFLPGQDDPAAVVFGAAVKALCGRPKADNEITCRISHCNAEYRYAASTRSAWSCGSKRVNVRFPRRSNVSNSNVTQWGGFQSH